MYDAHGERLGTEVGEKISFKVCSTNDSLKLTMEKIEASPKIVIVGAPLNEIAAKIKNGKNKGKDETIKQVVESQNKLINQYAEFHTETVFMVVPPFLRKEPAWMEEKMRICSFYIGDFIKLKSPTNVAMATLIPIEETDLAPDKLHLGEKGAEKLFTTIRGDILACKESIGNGPLSQDWAAQLWESQETPPTPANVKKRARAERVEEDDEDEEEEEDTNPKKIKNDSTIDKIYLLVKEMKSEAATSRKDFAKINTKVESVKKEVAEIKEAANRDNLVTAEIKEDMDGLENENLKSIVVIRKLKATKPVPKDSKELRTYVQDLARELVKKILKDGESAKTVKYAATLFSFIDPLKKDNKKGLVPPFKICFHSKDAAVRFRETAVKMAREGKKKPDAMEVEGWEEESEPTQENEFSNTYFTYFQTAGTRIRVLLMWAVADALKSKTKQVWVNQSSRPTLQVKEGGKIIRNLSFVKTMTEYKEKIGAEKLVEIKKVAEKNFAGQLEKTFIVLKD